MKTIKKNAYIQNSTLIIHDLESMNYKEVDVIIIPRKNNSKNRSVNIHPFHRKIT